MVIEIGTIKFEEADHANIPINVLLVETEEKNKRNGEWQLTATNYTPRRDELAECAFHAFGNRDELAELVNKHVLPLYQVAVKNLQSICEKKSGALHYWVEE